jgi:hypothetical protein
VRRWLILAFLLVCTAFLFPKCAQAQTVTLLQSASGPSDGTTSTTTYILRFPSLTSANNLLTFACNWSDAGNTITGSAADDKGNTWTGGTKQNNGSQSLQIFFTAGAAAGTSKVTVTLSAGATSFQCGAVGEFNNIATSGALDVQSGNTGNSTTPTCGSATPSQTGDLVLMYAIDTSGGFPSWTAGVQGNITWALKVADVLEASAAQWGQYSSVAALNPTITKGATGAWVAACIFFKSASAGTALGAGMKIRSVAVIGFTNLTFTSPITVQFPCVGNLIVLKWIGAPGDDISSITSSPSFTWTQIGSVFFFNSSGDIQSWYVKNASCSTALSVTVTLNVASAQNSTIAFYDVSGADPTAPLDTTFGTSGRVTCSGNQAAGGNLTMCTGTPAAGGELIILNTAVSSNTLIDPLTAAGQSPVFDGFGLQCGVGGGSGCAQENNLWGHNVATGAAAETFVSTTQGGAVGDWAGDMVAFKAAPAGTGGTKVAVPTKVAGPTVVH